MPPSLETLQQPPFHHEMILVEGGTFMMGCEAPDASPLEAPEHPETVGDFYIAKCTVTQGLWKLVMGNLPEEPEVDIDSLPVTHISWNMAQAFIKKLIKLTGKPYRLPTEAEWEYAARGGKYSRGYKYAGSDKLAEVGWYSRNVGSHRRPVGQKDPNELGLHDMCGNVWEWCQDPWRFYTDEELSDDADPEADRTYRGGRWLDKAEGNRLTERFCDAPDEATEYHGFRLACSIEKTSNP